MSKFPKLTEAQREVLFALVEAQRQAGKEINFEVGRDGSRAAISRQEPDQAVISDLPYEVFELWHEQGYVYLRVQIVGSSWPQPASAALILRQEALDYERRMRKPRPMRALLGALDTWGTDLRSLTVAIIGTILTALVLHWLGLLG